MARDALKERHTRKIAPPETKNACVYLLRSKIELVGLSAPGPGLSISMAWLRRTRDT